MFDAVEKHYGINIEYTFPDAEETLELVRAKGMFSFYEDGHQECCQVRKVLLALCYFWSLHAVFAASHRLFLEIKALFLSVLCSRT